MAEVYFKLIKAKVKTLIDVPDVNTLRVDVQRLLTEAGLDGKGEPLSPQE